MANPAPIAIVALGFVGFSALMVGVLFLNPALKPYRLPLLAVMGLIFVATIVGLAVMATMAGP